MAVYTAAGLKSLAIYLDSLLEGDNKLFESQNALAEIAGVPANSIKSLRRNRDITEDRFVERKYHKPALETIHALAAVIPDPQTGKPFDPNGQPCRLEAVCRGWDTLYGEVNDNPAIAVISKEYKARPKAFAAIAKADMEKLLAGDKPTLRQLMQLQTALQMPFDELIALFGVDPNQQISDHSNGNKTQAYR